MRFFVYLIIDKTDHNLPLYVGKGQSNYGNRPGRHWSRIDVHKNEIKRSLLMPDEELNSRYRKLKALIQANHELDFQVIFESDDGIETKLQEANFINSYRVVNPGLLNICGGDDSGRHGPRGSMSLDHRRAISDRLRGVKRGFYKTKLSDLPPELRKARSQEMIRKRYELVKSGEIKVDGKLKGLTAEQQIERRAERARIARFIRVARKGGDVAEVERLEERLREIDRSFGLEPVVGMPKSYGPANRPHANMTLEQEKEFLVEITSRTGWKVQDVFEALKRRFGVASLSAAYAMLHRHEIKAPRKFGRQE